MESIPVRWAAITALALVVAAIALTRSPADPCPALYEQVAACTPDLALVTREAYLAACGARPADDPARDCLDRGGCEAFAACYRPTVTVDAGQRQLDQIKAHIAAQAWGRAISACNTAGKNTRERPDFAATCRPVWARQYDETLAERLDQRDAGRPGKCRGLVLVAKRVGGEKVAEAETLCAEIAQIGPAARLIAASATARTGGVRPDLMPRCAQTLAALDAIGSPWAQQQATAVATACYVEAGGPMIVGVMSGPEPACEPALKIAVAGLVARGLSSPEVAPHLAGAQALCGVEAAPPAAAQ